MQRQRTTRHRWLCGGLVAVAAMAAAAPLTAALAPARDIAFAILRGDAPIGHHNVSFELSGLDLIVQIAIGIEVRFAFLTLYRYQHENREVWRDGRLVALETWTNDDGTIYGVTARDTPEGLWVEGADGAFLAPPDIIPTSYWNPATVEQSRLLDTQRGRLLEVAIEPSGVDVIAAGPSNVPVRRYAVTGDLNLDLWYTEHGEWAKIAFEARGSAIDYAPAESWARRLGGSN